MSKTIRHFLRSEDGAVTVDWVVLTAGVVALAAGAIVSIQGANGSVGAAMESYLVGLRFW